MIGMAVGSTTSGKSLMYIKKSKGPKIDPCGTPCVTFVHFVQSENVLVFEYELEI
jgi:hypothetical protein